MKRLKLVYIEWQDACSVQHWHTYEDAMDWANNVTPYIKQVGWILQEDNKQIVLAARQGEHIFESEDFEEQSYGLLQKIPKTWIRKRFEITEKASKKDEPN